MSGDATKRLLREYLENSPTTDFLSGLFQSPAENFHSSESVEIDLVRSEEDVAVVVTDLSVNGNKNSTDLYTNKEFVPPIYKEAFGIPAHKLIKRDPGQNPFQDGEFQAKASRRFMLSAQRVERKIRRSIELQASQIWQTGILTLTDANGNALYTLDFKPKASHFPTAGTAWNAGGATPINDLISLCNQVRDDGKMRPDTCVMGEATFEAFVSNSDVQARANLRRIDLLEIRQMRMNANGGNFRGTIDVGNFKLELWTYSGKFTDPQTGNATKYIDNESAIVFAMDGRRDATFGAIPQLVPPEQRVLPFIPAEIASPDRGLAMSTFAWVTPDGSELMGSVGARPLLIPTAIDTFGRLDTLVT